MELKQSKDAKLQLAAGSRSLDRMVRRRLAETKAWQARKTIGTLGIDIKEWAECLDEALDQRNWKGSLTALREILCDARALEVELRKLESPNGRDSRSDEAQPR